MQAAYINPFISSLKNTFQTMLACKARRGALSLKEDCKAKHQVSGVIGLSGKAVGTVVLSLSEEVALQAAATMLMCEATQIDDDVLDAVGELTNIVAGGAKAELEEYQLMVSLPNVVTGSDHDIHFPTQVTPICIAFETDWGPMTLEVGLAAIEAPAAV